MPNTWVTPHATMVSTIASPTVRTAGASGTRPTYTPSSLTSTAKHVGASSNGGGGAPVSGS